MVINPIVKPAKYDVHKESKDTSEHNRKQHNKNKKVSFSQVLSQAKGAKDYLYSKEYFDKQLV